jgi:hypothetical protein
MSLELAIYGFGSYIPLLTIADMLYCWPCAVNQSIANKDIDNGKEM